MKEMRPLPSRRRVLQAASVGLGTTVTGCLGIMGDEPEKPERSADAPPLKWISEVDRYPWEMPTIDDRTIYCGSSFHVTALDVADGSERWHYEIDTPNDNICYSGKIGVDDSMVYTQGCDEVYALDDAGEVQWAVDDGRKHLEPATAPAISETGLFIGGYGLVRRNRTTGNQEWKTDINGETRAKPTLGEEYVFIGASTGQVEAFDRGSGERQFVLETETDHASAPLVKDGFIFIGTAVFPDEGEGTGYLYAGDIQDERWLWRIETGYILNNLPPAVHEDTLFVVSDAGILYAISVADGSVRWTYDTEAEDPSAPRIGDDLVHIASGDSIHAVDIATGEQRWHVSWNDSLPVGRGSPPLVTEDALYVGTSHRMYAFDRSGLGRGTAS